MWKPRVETWTLDHRVSMPRRLKQGSSLKKDSYTRMFSDLILGTIHNFIATPFRVIPLFETLV